MFNVLPIVRRSSMFVFVLLCITLCPFLFFNHIEEEEKPGCFAIIVLQMFVCFVALRPMSTAMVIAGRSVHLTTLFPGQA